MLHLNLRKIRLTIRAVQSDSISSYSDYIENSQALEMSIVKKCTEYIGGKICIVPVCLKKAFDLIERNSLISEHRKHQLVTPYEWLGDYFLQ